MDYITDGVGEQGSEIARAAHAERETVVQHHAAVRGALSQAAAGSNADGNTAIASSQIYTGSEKRTVGEDVGVGVLEARVARDAVWACGDEVGGSVHCIREVLSKGGAVKEDSSLVDVFRDRSSCVDVDGDAVGAVGEVRGEEGEVLQCQLVVCPQFYSLGSVYS